MAQFNKFFSWCRPKLVVLVHLLIIIRRLQCALKCDGSALIFQRIPNKTNIFGSTNYDVSPGISVVNIHKVVPNLCFCSGLVS